MSRLLASTLKLMSSSPCAGKALVALLLLVGSLACTASDAYVAQADEYSASGALFGDQVEAAVAVSPSGGLLVWQDNFTDGDGSGISARRLDSTFSGVLSSFRVNVNGAGNQSRPEVAMLSGGGAVVVWEGIAGGSEDVFARFFVPSNNNLVAVTGDVPVNSYTPEPQEDPVVAALDNDESVVVWSSYNQTPGNMKDVYFQRFSGTGQKLGGEVRVNQTLTLNQRTPDVVRLQDGRFAVAWISESAYLAGGTNQLYAVDVMARIYDSAGVPQTNQFKISSTTNACANPKLAANADGGFLVTWSQKDTLTRDNSWDILARSFSASAEGGTERMLNSYRYGDQFGPKPASLGSDYFVIWTSLRQDGSHEGVFGRFLKPNGLPDGDEFQVNTTSVNKQILPDLASDGGTRFLAVWSGFTGVSGGFDVFGQRYATVLDPLVAPDPPYVWALSDSALKVSWPSLAGFAVANYEVYANGAASPSVATTNNWWTASSLAPNTLYTFRIRYTLTDGRSSPMSGPSSGTTYGAYGDLTYFWDDTVPADWLVRYWGTKMSNWPDMDADSDGDGASNKAEFLAGTDPKDPGSVLRTRLSPTSQGFYLDWNTEPGRIYQVQRCTDFVHWSEVGGPRFAAGDVDSVYVGGLNAGMFRVILFRN